MKVTFKIKDEYFRSDSNKGAMVLCTRFIAEELMKNKEFSFKFDIVEKGVCKLEIFSEFDVDELFKSRCNACQSFHSKFYINHQYNCDKCNAKGLMDHMSEKLKTKQSELIRIINGYYERS